ncbi:hypothetical protein CEP54_011587 [Fusarium duplospermum]|uniref:Uncharacterized protein n=1 Tax=Fusarium duplospermum TaxID=1325734 RepID=A0A428PDK8_9HYPO|nr:hypothetical protein CEP54_011587 [Fusarium duplospermum]
MPSRALLAFLLFLPCSVQALFGSSNETDFWSEFGNNFATDLAPIISLFGEQVTKQFLSESTTILDTIIFAVGPLGIITAIVSCIRVSGSSFLKSVVGRAREPHAVPEVELCSSTSENVCELWSNGGICRVFGRPKILEFISRQPSEDVFYAGYDSDGDEEEPATCGIFLTREILRMEPSSSGHATESEIQEHDWRAISSAEFLFLPFSNLVHQIRTWIKTRLKSAFDTAATASPEDIELGSMSESCRRGQEATDEDSDGEDDGVTAFAPFPNLALNIGVQKGQTSILTLWIATVFGLLLQSSFFGYTIWATWYHPTFYEGGKSSNTPLFFTFTIAGTASIILGMALCATLIDRNSKEQRIVLSSVKGTERPEYRMFWLQPGGQRIGDQEFDAFACNEAKTEYIASWNNRQTPVSILLVWVGVGLSFVGWMVQFIGLRGQHATVSLYQLCCTIVMSIIRASIRSSRSTPRNELEHRSEELQGHELDWQAIQLITEWDQTDKVNARISPTYWSIQSWARENVPTHEISDTLDEMEIGNNVAVLLTWRNRARATDLVQRIESNHSYFFDLAEEGGSDSGEILERIGTSSAKSCSPNSAAKLMRIRTRLAHLTKQLPYQAWEIDTRKTALQLKNALQKSTEFLYLKKARSLVWSTECCLSGTGQSQSREMDICFCMMNTKAGWTIDVNQLEATLGLWSWSVERYAAEHMDSEEWLERRRIKGIVVRREDAEATCFILNQWGLSDDVLGRGNLVQHLRLTNLSVPNMVSFGSRSEISQVTTLHGPRYVTPLSLSTAGSLLQMMAQDLFTTFVETLGTHRLRRLENATALNLSVSDTEETTAIEGMVQSLVSEGLATRNEAIMSVLPALCSRLGSPGGIQAQCLLFTQAMSLKRREKFDESQRVAKTLAKLGSTKAEARAEAFLFGTYRSELRWMMQRRRSFNNRDCLKKRMELILDIQWFRATDHFRRLQQSYVNVIDWLLWSNRVTSAFVGGADNSILTAQETSVLKTMQPTSETPTLLDRRTLDDLNLDGTVSRRDAFELALTLDQRFNLGESTVQVRKQLLRWAIESDCTYLVEDLWNAERNDTWTESAFSGGSDELFWAANLRTDSHDMINTILTLLEVVGMDQYASLECREELDQLCWETSRKRDFIKAKYEQDSNVLAAASANHDGLDVIELLTWDLRRRDELNPNYVCEAVESALERGTLETFDCLMTKAVQWRSRNGLYLHLLPILAKWGLEQRVKAILPEYGWEIFHGLLEYLPETARIELPSEKEERAKEVFKADRDGLVAFLGAQRKGAR